jgi:selenocysteine lyase/cysteine desulfurase
VKSGLETTDDNMVPTVATIQSKSEPLERPFAPDLVRDQFPALRLLSGAREVVFLDGPGGTQVPSSVIAAM